MTSQAEKVQDSLQPIDPIVDRDNAFFWEAAKRGELVTRVCDRCGHSEFPPAPMCPNCHGLTWTEKKLSGRGTVSGWLKIHHPPMPIFTYPLRIVTVKLEDGPELISNLLDADQVEDPTDLAVEVVFAPTRGGWKLPLFRPRTRD
jgi:uncharacterized OB-fold protein